MEFTFWSNFLWFMPLFWSIAFVAPKHPFAFRISRSKEMHLRVYLVVHVMIPTRLEQSLCGSITDHSYKYKAILKLRFDVTHQAVQSSCSRWFLHWCLLLIFFLHTWQWAVSTVSSIATSTHTTRLIMICQECLTSFMSIYIYYKRDDKLRQPTLFHIHLC